MTKSRLMRDIEKRADKKADRLLKYEEKRKKELDLLIKEHKTKSIKVPYVANLEKPTQEAQDLVIKKAEDKRERKAQKRLRER